MKIADRVITEAELAAGVTRMRQGRFRCRDITQALEAAGVDRYAYRAADRLIQRESKAKRICFIKQGPFWVPVGTI